MEVDGWHVDLLLAMSVNMSEGSDMATSENYWGPASIHEFNTVPQVFRLDYCTDFEGMWQAMTCEKAAEAVELTLNSASGLDGITSRQYTSITVSLKALLFNSILARGRFRPGCQLVNSKRK